MPGRYIFPKKDATKFISKTLEEQRSRADLYFKGVTVSEIVAGVKYWEIKASTSVINKTTGLNTLKGTKGTFFKEGNPVLKFIAPKAVWDIQKKEIYLTEPIGYDIKSEKGIEEKIKTWRQVSNVFSVFHLPAKYPIPSKLGYWFASKNLEWGLADQKIICKEGLTLTKGDISIVAEKLEADVALEKVILTGKPQAVIEQGEKIIITAERFEIDGKAELVEISEQVKVTRGDIKTWSNEAKYLMKDRKIVLTGNPIFQRRGSKLSGEKVIISLKEQKVIIEGKTKVIVGEEEFK